MVRKLAENQHDIGGNDSRSLEGDGVKGSDEGKFEE